MVMASVASRSWAAFPLYDGFETYPVGVSLNGSNGWVTADAGFSAQGSIVWNPALGSQSAALPPSATVSNVIPSSSATNVWIDFYVTNAAPAAAGSFTVEDVDTNLAAMWYVETNGFPVVWHPASNAWLVCSNDYWGTATTNFNTNAWMRFTLCENYSNKTAALFLNQHLMLQQVRFINTNLTASVLFGVCGAYTATSYFDEVAVRYFPTNMTDLDHDGMTEAEEIQNNGSVDVRHRPVITVVQPLNGSIAPSGVLDVLPGSSTSFTFCADITYVVSQVFTNGQSVGVFTGQNTRNATWEWNSVIADGFSDGTVSARVSYVRTRYVPQDGYATIQAAMAAALAGETIVVSAGAYAGVVAMSNGVLLAGTGVTLSGGLTIGAGATGTLSACSGWGVSNTVVGGHLVVSNGTVDLGAVTFTGGGSIQLVNVDSVTINGATLSGSRRIESNWGALTAQTAPFQDDFERYGIGVTLSSQGAFGWSADSAGVVVESNTVLHGAKAVVLPTGAVLSNSLAPVASSNIWVAWNLHDAGRIDESTVELESRWTNATVVLFLNTNGYVTVYDAQTASFNVLSNDIAGNEVKVGATDWPRVILNLNYSSRLVAIFLNGHLMKQQLRYINTNQANCASMAWEAGSSVPANVDDVGVWTNALAELEVGDYRDLDGDGISDAIEIHQHGSLLVVPGGSVFKIR